MTALTGETGAGKTMLVEAIDLLVGGRADAGVVAAGADEAVVEGRFVVTATTASEVVLRRVVPARRPQPRPTSTGAWPRSRRWPSWAPGWSTSTASTPTSRCSPPATQRGALDRFAGVDLAAAGRGPRRHGAGSLDELARLGGDERARAREIDLLRFQVDELDAAGLDDPDEDERARGRGGRSWPTPSAHREAAAARPRRRWPTTAARSTGSASPSPRSPGRAPFAAADDRLRVGRRRARRRARRPAAARRGASRTTPSASPRSAPGASSCTSCAASTATRWPR